MLKIAERLSHSSLSFVPGLSCPGSREGLLAPGQLPGDDLLPSSDPTSPAHPPPLLLPSWHRAAKRLIVPSLSTPSIPRLLYNAQISLVYPSLSLSSCANIGIFPPEGRGFLRGRASKSLANSQGLLIQKGHRFYTLWRKHRQKFPLLLFSTCCVVVPYLHGHGYVRAAIMTKSALFLSLADWVQLLLLCVPGAVQKMQHRLF